MNTTCYLTSKVTGNKADIADIKGILKDSRLFANLTPDKIDQLIGISNIRSFKKHDRIITDNEPVNFFFVILRGTVKAIMLGKRGRAFTLDIYTKGNTFLSTAFFSRQPAWCSAIAMEPVELLCIPRHAFVPFLMLNAGPILNCLGYLAEGFQMSVRLIKDCCSQKVDDQIAFALQRLSERIGDVINYTAEEIATLAGTTTETTIRHLAKFRNAGIISTERGKITILDRKKLLNHHVAMVRH